MVGYEARRKNLPFSELVDIEEGRLKDFKEDVLRHLDVYSMLEFQISSVINFSTMNVPTRRSPVIFFIELQV